jgi:folate-dependent phosphoribosylglycinamide formyltransferase PurN
MRVVVFFSGSASSARFVMHEQQRQPELAKLFEVVGAFTDTHNASAIEFFKQQGVDVEVEDIKMFYSRHRAELKDMKIREKYYQIVLDSIKHWKPDIIMLSGFMKILTEPLLGAFEYRILNVHPADLTIKTPDGRRRYVGDDAVYDAVVAGEHTLCSTIHIVTNEVDCGPIVVMSKRVSVQQELVKALQKNAPGKIRLYVDALQEWMKWECDGPAYLKALVLFSAGAVGRKDDEIFIKDAGRWRKGFYDLEKGRVVATS